MRIVPFFKRLLSAAPVKETGEHTRILTARVSEVYRLHGVACAVVSDDSPLHSIIVRFADEPGLRGMFPVDSQQRLTGVVSRIDLLKWAHIQLFGGKGRHEIRIPEFLRLVDARRARDIAHSASKVLSVRESDTLEAALDRMLDHEEDVLPVLDSQGDVVGDLRLSEVLLWVLTHGRRKLESHD